MNDWSRLTGWFAGAWLLTGAGVATLVATRAVATGGVTLDAAEDLGSGLVIGLWLLPAVAWARDGSDVFERLFSAFFTAVFAIFGLKLFLRFGGWVNDMLWGLVSGFVPDVPAILVRIGDVIATLGAEGLFLYLMLGYTWSMHRQQFDRWSSGEED